VAEQLRVLLVEDSEDDALLILRELERGGYEVSAQRVVSEQEMREALDRQPWDVVILDYHVPGFGALPALAVLNEKNLDLPTVVVSGAVGEEKAAEVMRLGAHDLVLKDNLSRLLPAVERELREAEERRRRRLAEQELRESEERYRLHFNHVRDLIYAVDQDSRLTSVSPSVRQLLGYAPEELVGQRLEDTQILAPESLRHALAQLARQQDGDASSSTTEYEFVAKDGAPLYAEVTSAPLFRHGRPCGMVSVARDVSERKRAEEELRKERDFNKKLIEASPAFFVAISPELKTIMMNQVMLNALGYTLGEVVGTHYLNKFVPERERPAVLQVFNDLRYKKVSTVNENHVLTKDGRELLVEWHGMPVVGENGELEFFFGLGLDITERKRAEEEQRKLQEQLRQAQKMEAIGTLAGGVAHDFNNILTGILGQAQMLKLHSSPGSEAYEAAQVIEKAAQRGAQLTQQLLGFARKGQMQNVLVDLHEVIGDVIQLLSRTIPKNISIVKEFHAPRATIIGDPGQMEQMLLNLAINARDAMPEGGELKFATELVRIEASYVRTHADIERGEYVCVSVADTGCGIPKEIQPRIFEPFFTTKEPGEGTGMGLAMVYGIVKSHKGTIEVASEVGQGTTFKIYLPLAEQPDKAERPEREEVFARGSGRILLVDDEELIRDIGRDILNHLGYEVVTAADGEQAVEYYKEHADEIDLVIIDMIMPRMDGRKCFRKLKEINPNVKAVLSTGYAVDALAQELLEEGMMGYVQKPYRIEQLAETVARAIAGKPPAENSDRAEDASDS